jgi:hypothetical protein
MRGQQVHLRERMPNAMFVTLSTYFYAGARMLNYSRKDVVYTNGAMFFAIFAHLLIKSLHLTVARILAVSQCDPAPCIHKNRVISFTLNKYSFPREFFKNMIYPYAAAAIGKISQTFNKPIKPGLIDQQLKNTVFHSG